MALFGGVHRRLQLQTGHLVGPLGPWRQIRGKKSRQRDQACVMTRPSAVLRLSMSVGELTPAAQRGRACQG
ncbi:jg3490 [Pararge aegeria aegeria]|uniref:Jg3490 protein n=1 Tax=Pararge aegeria aegeria TaxID=348720 RepID=A0A8S4SE53_9NEOP|nr:jg3490 [Pararge aegeria aegeria]